MKFSSKCTQLENTMGEIIQTQKDNVCALSFEGPMPILRK